MQVGAPTGSAAFLVEGNTLHKLLHLRISNSRDELKEPLTTGSKVANLPEKSANSLVRGNVPRKLPVKFQYVPFNFLLTSCKFPVKFFFDCK